MLLQENKRYLDNQSIQAGLATEKLNHIIVDRHFTEEEKEANLKFYEAASQEERTKRINDWKIRDKHDIDIIIGKLIAALGDAKHHFGLIRSEFGHLRIEPYKEATEAEISNVLDVLRGIDLANRQAIVNYSTKYDETACKEKAREIYQKNDGKFVTYGDWTGRLKYNEAENHYYFMKKGARSKGYYINEKQICTGVKEV